MTWHTEITPPWEPPQDSLFPNRHLYLGASDTPAALGKSRWKSPLSLWMGKLRISESKPQTEPMHWGHEHEPLIVRNVADRLGLSH